MQLNPSAVLVPCVFAGMGQAGRGVTDQRRDETCWGWRDEEQGVEEPSRHDRRAGAGGSVQQTGSVSDDVELRFNCLMHQCQRQLCPLVLPAVVSWG